MALILLFMNPVKLLYEGNPQGQGCILEVIENMGGRGALPSIYIDMMELLCGDNSLASLSL